MSRTILSAKLAVPENRKTLNAAEIRVFLMLKDDDEASGFDDKQDRIYYARLKEFSTKVWPEFKKKQKFEAVIAKILKETQTKLDNAAKGNHDAKAWAKKQNAIIVEGRAKLNKACYLWGKSLSLEAQRFYAELLATMPEGKESPPEPTEPEPSKPKMPTRKDYRTDDELMEALAKYQDELVPEWEAKTKEWKKKVEDQRRAALKEREDERKKAYLARKNPSKYAEKFDAEFRVIGGPKQR